MSVTVDVSKWITPAFSELLRRVALGEELIIAQGGEPIARLSPYRHEPRRPRVPGKAVGLEVSEAFFEPLPEDILRTFR